MHLRVLVVQLTLKKWRYLSDEVFSEIHPSKWKTGIYWLAIVTLIVAGLLRIYLKGAGQWLFLKTCRWIHEGGSTGLKGQACILVCIYVFTGSPCTTSMRASSLSEFASTTHR